MLILASSSPRRYDLLQQIGVTPDIVFSPDIDEKPAAQEKPRLYVARTAKAKLSAACQNFAEDSFILSADTAVCVGTRILPKPSSREEARFCLDLLSGRSHRVFTAVFLKTPDQKIRYRLAESRVIFTRLEKSQKEAYLASEEWQGKAGGYALQGRAAQFIRQISGSYSNIIGLPLFETAQLLRGVGFLRP